MVKKLRCLGWVVIFACFGCAGAANEGPASPATVSKVAKEREPAGANQKARAEVDASTKELLDRATANILEALDKPGPAVSGVLSSGDDPPGLFDEGLEAGAGAGSDPDEGGGGLAAIGTTSTGRPGPVPRVRGNVSIGPVTVNDGWLENADALVSRYRTAFRICYERVLRTQPTQQGTLVVELDVDKVGRVADVRTAVREGVDSDVAVCIERRALRMIFGAISSEVTLAFQLRFEPMASEP